MASSNATVLAALNTWQTKNGGKDPTHAHWLKIASVLWNKDTGDAYDSSKPSGIAAFQAIAPEEYAAHTAKEATNDALRTTWLSSTDGIKYSKKRRTPKKASSKASAQADQVVLPSASAKASAKASSKASSKDFAKPSASESLGVSSASDSDEEPEKTQWEKVEALARDLGDLKKSYKAMPSGLQRDAAKTRFTTVYTEYKAAKSAHAVLK